MYFEGVGKTTLIVQFVYNNFLDRDDSSLPREGVFPSYSSVKSNWFYPGMHRKRCYIDDESVILEIDDQGFGSPENLQFVSILLGAWSDLTSPSP